LGCIQDFNRSPDKTPLCVKGCDQSWTSDCFSAIGLMDASQKIGIYSVTDEFFGEPQDYFQKAARLLLEEFPSHLQLPWTKSLLEKLSKPYCARECNPDDLCIVMCGIVLEVGLWSFHESQESNLFKDVRSCINWGNPEYQCYKERVSSSSEADLKCIIRPFINAVSKVAKERFKNPEHAKKELKKILAQKLEVRLH